MNRVADAMRDAAAAIAKAEPVDVSALRTLQGVIEEQMKVENSPDEALVILFLGLFLDDVFYNLAGDFPYHLDNFEVNADLNELWGKESYRIRDTFFRDLAPANSRSHR